MDLELLEWLEQHIEKIRMEAIIGRDEATGLTAEAEALALLAVNGLAMARQYVLLAIFAQRKALAEGRR